METIKEAIEEHIPFPPNPDEVFEATEQFLYGLQVARFIQGVVWSERWIPVEEELPPIGENITILLKGEGENGKETFNVHTFDKITNHKRLKGWFDFYDFTHWRPINHE